MRQQTLAWLIVSGLVLSAAAPAAARPQDEAPDYRLEEQLPASPITAASHRLLTRQETERRTVERQVVQRPSINGGYEAVLEVVEETVRIDPRTIRRTRRELQPDPNGGKRLVRTVEERREEGPDGRLRVVRTISEPDLNGGSRATRREVVTTVPVGGGAYRTEIETAVPGMDGSGLVAVERIEQTERREGERLLESERTSHRRPVGAPRWEATERRITNVEHGDREVRAVEQVYRLDGNGDLTLNDRIVSREWTDARGTERFTQEVHSTDVPFLARSNAPRLHRRIDVVQTRRPDGSRQVTREVRELEMNGFPLVERVIEESRPTPVGTTTIRTVQRPDGNGRLQTVSVSRSEESGS